MNTEKMKYTTNHFRTTDIRDRVLVTTEHGSWVDLSKDEFKLLKSNNVEQDQTLFRKLEEKGVILTKSNLNDVINGYRDRKCQLFQGTSLHIIVPTLRCNHKCLYCHSKARNEDESGYDMDENTAKAVIDFIFQTPSQNVMIEFQGGEPLLNFPLIRYIVEYAQKKNQEYKKKLMISLVTNLTKMDDDIAKYLTSINGFSICTSLDGPKEVHDRNRMYRNGSGPYENVVYWIRRLREDFGYDRMNALMVTTRHSLPYWKEIVDEYVKWGFGRIMLKPLNDLGFARGSWNEISITPQEYFGFWSKSVDYIVKNDIDIMEVMTHIILRKYLSGKDPMFTDIMSPCGAAISQLAYDQKGDIYICDEARMYEEFRLGNAKENNYREILTSPQTCAIIAASTNDSYLCDNCTWKPYCGICMVCSYASHGNIIGKVPFIDNRCKILQKQFRYVFEKLLFDEKHGRVFRKWAELNLNELPGTNINRENEL